MNKSTEAKLKEAELRLKMDNAERAWLFTEVYGYPKTTTKESTIEHNADIERLKNKYHDIEKEYYKLKRKDKMIKCPECNSENITTEKRPNGNSICQDCGYGGSSILFHFQDTEPSTTDIYEKLKVIENQNKKIIKYIDDIEQKKLNEQLSRPCCPSKTIV